MIFGWIFQEGVTVGDGQGADIAAQFGYGDYLTTPGVHASWVWSDGTYNGDKDGLTPGDKSNDEYMGILGSIPAGKYSYCFRFSYKNSPWLYGDIDGSDNGLQLDQLGELNVIPTPDDIKNRLLGIPITGNLDVNNDGKIDIADLVYLIKGL
jgi:hypothetical protein